MLKNSNMFHQLVVGEAERLSIDQFLVEEEKEIRE